MRVRGVVRVILLALLALLLAACGGDDAENGAPDGDPAAAASPTAPGAQLPPTWTPGPEGSVATAQPSATAPDAPAAEVAPAEQGLPPTWTPRPPAAQAFPAGPTHTPDPGRPTWTPLPDWCYALQPLSAPGTSYIQHPVNIMWAGVPDVAYYRVELRNLAGTTLINEVTTATGFMFPGNLFSAADVYGWQVVPLDESGRPTCYAISDEIVVRVPPS